jgi:hypothetical protein
MDENLVFDCRKSTDGVETCGLGLAGYFDFFNMETHLNLCGSDVENRTCRTLHDSSDFAIGHIDMLCNVLCT